MPRSQGFLGISVFFYFRCFSNTPMDVDANQLRSTLIWTTCRPNVRMFFVLFAIYLLALWKKNEADIIFPCAFSLLLFIALIFDCVVLELLQHVWTSNNVCGLLNNALFKNNSLYAKEAFISDISWHDVAYDHGKIWAKTMHDCEAIMPRRWTFHAASKARAIIIMDTQTDHLWLECEAGICFVWPWKQTVSNTYL